MEKVMIFDMDGVIVDSEYTFWESKSEILLEEGVRVETDYHYQFMGTTSEFMWQKMKEEFDLPNSVDTYIAEMNRRRDVMMERDGVRPIKGVLPLIHWLHKHGYRMAVASSSPMKDITRTLMELGVADCFAYKLTGDEVAHSKPAPDIYLAAADLLQADPSDCKVIEDTKNGSRAAKAAGMYCFGFANPDYPDQDLSAADCILTDYDDIYPYLEK